MKKILVMTLVALFSLTFAAVEAQNNDEGKQAPPQRGMRVTAKERAEQMAKQLDLTAEQKTKVQALLEKQDAKRKEQMAQQREDQEKAKQDREKSREEMKALREKEIAQNDAELEAIIGKEKVEQWKQYREDLMKKMREKGPRGERKSNDQ